MKQEIRMISWPLCMIAEEKAANPYFERQKAQVPSTWIPAEYFACLTFDLLLLVIF